MQQYMCPSLLRSAGLQNFDDWAATFGEVVSQLEMKPAGDGYRTKNRFARFVNLPELMAMYKEFADIRTAEMLNLPVPDIEGGKPQVIAAKPNEFQLSYMKTLAARSESIHSGAVDPRTDNMLKVTNEARLLGLDARTINADAENYPDSKVNLCVDKVMEIYEKTSDTKGVQAIFCDIAINDGAKSAPTLDAESPDEQTETEPAEKGAEAKSAALYDSKFSVYKYLKAELIRRGIPENEVCFAGDAQNQKQRSEMYAQLRSGTKRIVIASTSKMGTGANIQTKLCALHNLDIPWKPSDYEQRLGRIVRQGNENPTVGVYNYVTEGTFDAYMLNLIVTKQKFISQLMSGKTPARTCEDVDDTVLNYSEMQAIASGDPRIKEKIELDGEVARLRMLESEHYNQKYRMDDLVVSLKAQLSINTKKLETAKADKEYAAGHTLPEGEFAIKLGGKNFTERKDAGAELRREIMAVIKDRQSREIGEYRGFTVSLTMNGFASTPLMELRAKGLTYSANTELLSDLGDIVRLENVVKLGIDKEISRLEGLLSDDERDLKQAEASKDLPFALADELAKKSARLEQLNNELDVGKSEEQAIGDDDEKQDPPDLKPNTPKRRR